MTACRVRRLACGSRAKSILGPSALQAHCGICACCTPKAYAATRAIERQERAARGCTHVARLQHLDARRRRGARQRRDVAVVAALGLERLGRVRRRRPARARAHAGAARVQPPARPRRPRAACHRHGAAPGHARRRISFTTAPAGATPAPPRSRPRRRRRRPCARRARHRGAPPPRPPKRKPPPPPPKKEEDWEHSLRGPIRTAAATAAAAHRQPLGFEAN